MNVFGKYTEPKTPDRRRVIVPPARVPASQTTKNQSPRRDVSLPKDLATEREKFGFDDIPVDVEEFSFKEILVAWIRQGFRHSEMEDRGKKLHRFMKDKNLTGWKDDLKWALAADLDEESLRPKPKPPEQKKQAQPHASSTTVPPTAPSQASSKTIDVNINFGSLPSIPKLPRPNIKKTFARLRRPFRFRRSKKVLITSGTLIVICVGSAVSYQVLQVHSEAAQADKKQLTIDGSSAVGKIPEYKTITPGNKDVREFGGWARVSPPEANPVFAFADKLNGTPISVSQQPLPADFKDKTDEKIAELAKNYLATDKQKIDDTVFYVGTSAKGPQSVITTKNDLLILIKSTAKIDDKIWGQYINSLE